jgi:hypothetical protein
MIALQHIRLHKIKENKKQQTTTTTTKTAKETTFCNSYKKCADGKYKRNFIKQLF